MKDSSVKLMLKVFVLYVHREYSTYEIAAMLEMSVANVSLYLKKAETINRNLAVMIRKQRKLNLLNAQSKKQELKLGRN